ncbi:MAG: SDR family NAD(P)-dependent oxidoreductase [Campylobacterales bacterium]
MVKRTILITGATKGGIGYEVAKSLQQRGHSVVVTAKRDEVVDELRLEGFICFKLDYRDEDSIKAAYKDAKSALKGKVDVVFNNGAYGQPGALEDIDSMVLKEQFEANFFGWHTLIKEALPDMIKRDEGRIIQHSSVLGLVALRYRGAYNASKYALEGYSDTLRLELKDRGIKVITINTGPIESNFRDNAREAFIKNVDVERSFLSSLYKKQLEGKFAKGSKDDSIFSRGAEVVVKKLIKAIEDKNPKPRYYVTEATMLMEFLKRVLPTSMLDRVLLKVE